MEKPGNERARSPRDERMGQMRELTFADSRWAAMTHDLPGARPAMGGAGSRRLQVVPRASHQQSSWRAADPAPVEIAAVDRNERASAGRDRVVLDRAAAAVRDNLLEAAQAAAEASRRAQVLAQMLDEAIATLAIDHEAQPTPAPQAETRAPGATSALSRRERDVLTRVARGRSNKAIAEELYVSPNTVKTHVASLLRKLNVNTRAQLATIAVQQGLS